MRLFSSFVAGSLLITSVVSAQEPFAIQSHRGVDRETSLILNRSLASPLASYMATAFATDPLIKSYQLIVETEQATKKGVESFESPEVAVSMMRTKPDLQNNQQEYAIGITQMVEKPSLRKARGDAQEAKILQALTLLEAKKRELVGEIVEKGYIFAASWDLFSQARESWNLANMAKLKGEKQFKQGAVSHAHLMKLEVEEKRAKSEMGLKEIAYLQAKREFATATKTPVESLPDTLELPALVIPEIVDVQTLPVVHYYEALSQEKALLHDVTKLSALPGVKAGLGWQKSYDQSSVIASLALPLPLWSRTKHLEQAAYAQSRSTLQEYEAFKLNLSLAIDTHKEAIEKTKNLLAELDVMLSLAQEMERLAQKSHEEGYSTLLELLDARRTAIKAQSDRTQSLIELYRHAGFILKLTPYSTENK